MVKGLNTSIGSRGARGGSVSSRSDQIQLTIGLLDDSQFVRAFPKRAKGLDVLQAILDHLDLIERAYFGLQYTDEDDQMRWLDVSKSVRKQLKRTDPTVLYFRVKFYVLEPSRIQEELTRYQFFLQLKHDILRNKLPVSSDLAALLSAYSVQSELGDYDPSIHTQGYLSEFRFVPDQSEELEVHISQIHKTLSGQTPSDAEFNFLERVKHLDLYGIDLHYAKDHDDTELYLGVTANGVVVFANQQRINTFSWPKMKKISFKRKRFYIQLKQEEDSPYNDVVEFNLLSRKSSKSFWKTCVEHHSFFRLEEVKENRYKVVTMFRFGSKFRYSGRTQRQTEAEGRKKNRNLDFTRTPSKRFQRRNIGPYTTFSLDRNKQVGLTPPPPPPVAPAVGAQKPTQPVSPLEIEETDVVKKEAPPQPDIIMSAVPVPTEPPDDRNPVSSDGLLTIKLEPDERGRFGFNVKGGADQNLPVVVSKVTPGTPASTVIPQLTEGDQVLFINGTTVADKNHEQVVLLIRETRDLNPRELKLVVKPASPIHWRIPNTEANLQTAMTTLREALDSDALCSQFENLYKKTPGLSMDDGKRPENASKNRYGDILPYDFTRVFLQEGTHDYINANFVNIELPHSGDVKRYIASQGTLESTVPDMWLMLWEQDIRLVVMLTHEYESGKLKCFRYWPASGQSITHGKIEVTCEEEVKIDDTATSRSFTVKDQETGLSRKIEQIQYFGWPDHGTPEDCHEFLRFVNLVRERRVGMQESIVVHCSAGVGRTGVFILIDTALYMLENNDSVYPLDLLRIMRDQRPLLVQTTDQYSFACSAILKAYDEKLYFLSQREDSADDS